MTRVALVTGVSRPQGIGHAIAHRLHAQHVDLFLHHYETYSGFPDVPHLDLDLTKPTAPQELVDAVISAYGRLDVLVCNHALDGHDGPLSTMTAATLDTHWAVNTRSSILLTKAFADVATAGGRVIYLTSGQDNGPMVNEIAYAASKGALASIVRSLSAALAAREITVNAVNPGPTDTGWASGELYEAVRAQSPTGRWGTPDDAARLIAWLAGEDASWVTGQVITSEGGFGH